MNNAGNKVDNIVNTTLFFFWFSMITTFLFAILFSLQFSSPSGFFVYFIPFSSKVYILSAALFLFLWDTEVAILRLEQFSNRPSMQTPQTYLSIHAELSQRFSASDFMNNMNIFVALVNIVSMIVGSFLVFPTVNLLFFNEVLFAFLVFYGCMRVNEQADGFFAFFTTNSKSPFLEGLGPGISLKREYELETNCPFRPSEDVESSSPSQSSSASNSNLLYTTWNPWT